MMMTLSSGHPCIFLFPTPSLTSMISSLQPSRPQAHSQRPQHPRYQQHTRSTHTKFPQPALVTSPRNQIEAMPPSKTVPEPPRMMPVYNPATMHPAFFSGNWRKQPFPLPINPSLSPATLGYVFPRPGSASGTKL
ncbi:hypothetical protein AC578_4748 [Pseudocercospora eumusae]|uniref:Uncharacterized protein n=1 Tax=Pseudocercospora eumusae TaxID=321146 RepID=A0A139HLB3_9PEZI|nr:hypothetical protein AC578_4748 [Pseudocercospora eumusae]